MTATSPTDLRELLSFALDMADEADRIALGYYRGELGTTEKSDGTLVTLADKAVEARLREMLAQRYPDHAILGEEQGYTAGAEGAGRWILDPIDGTHGFARGLPIWGTLIAYEAGGVVQLGVASGPALGTRWWAARGLGAYRGDTGAAGHAGQRIHVSEISHISESHVLNGSMKYALQRWPNAQAVNDLAWRERGYGDFWAHCLVAEGAAEAMFENGPNPWDLAALIVILEEAGGRLTDDQGRAVIDAGHAVSTNGRVHNELLGLLRA